jgi:DNA-binding NtrC family response regulator
MALRILVIDANRSALKYYRQILQAEGYDVEITTFAAANWRAIERMSPALIIFDLLADADQERQAWHLTQQLRASALTASIPLLVCTAAVTLTPFARFVHEGHIPILFKPLDATELTRIVRSMLLPPPGQPS